VIPGDDASEAGAAAAAHLAAHDAAHKTWAVSPDRLGFYLARHRRDAARLKQQARSITRALIEAGHVRQPPGACERCGVKGPTHVHHHDYTRPELVAHLCADCHRAQHRALVWQRLYDLADHTA